jgi:tetratricopeptide (TPR) repeat protein
MQVHANARRRACHCESERPALAWHDDDDLAPVRGAIADPQAAALDDRGMRAYEAGRWDEAAALYRRSALLSACAGGPVDTAYMDCKIGEILSDQGHLEEAATYLERAKHVWCATGEDGSAAFVEALLGRLDWRCGRHRQGLERLDAAVRQLRTMGLWQLADFAGALSAEAEAVGGDPWRAIALADELIAGADDQLPLLQRARAIALLRIGRSAEAVVALRNSLMAARERNASYEIAATLNALESLDGSHSRGRRERVDILERLQITRLPVLALDGS